MCLNMRCGSKRDVVQLHTGGKINLTFLLLFAYNGDLKYVFKGVVIIKL